MHASICTFVSSTARYGGHASSNTGVCAAFVVFLLGSPTHLSLSPDAPLDLLDAAGMPAEAGLDVFAEGDSAEVPYQPFKSLNPAAGTSMP
jgi:hypothetical protein